MPTDTTESSPESAGVPSAEYHALQGQRELALACAWLSLTISLAVLFSNFGKEPAAIPAAREAVENHRKILASAEEDLKANNDNLRQTREALANVKKAVNPGTP